MMQQDLNISLNVSKNQEGSHQNFSISTNNIEEIRKVIDALQTVQPEVVEPDQYMPYGNDYVSLTDFGATSEPESGCMAENTVENQDALNYAVQAMAWVNDPQEAAEMAVKYHGGDVNFIKQKLERMTPTDVRRIAMKDSIKNNSNKLNENFGDTNTYIAFNMMDETIETQYEGKKNPYSIHQAAEEVANIYADHMGLTEKEAIDWLSSLYYNERMKEFDEEGPEFEVDSVPSPDVFNSIPNMPGRNMSDFEPEIEPDLMEPMVNDIPELPMEGKVDEAFRGKIQSKQVDFKKFKSMMQRGKFEGLVLLGAGGNHEEWIRGVSQLLNDEQIAKTGDPEDLWMGAYELTTTGGRRDLALVFKSGGLDISRLATWRIRFGDASWISDYLQNYSDQHGIANPEFEYDEDDDMDESINEDIGLTSREEHRTSEVDYPMWAKHVKHYMDKGQPFHVAIRTVERRYKKTFSNEERNKIKNSMSELNEDADFDFRDEENGPKDPNSYNRERDIMDFARKGHSRKHLRRGGDGDNRLPDPEEEDTTYESVMFEEWEKFKKIKK